MTNTNRTNDGIRASARESDENDAQRRQVLVLGNGPRIRPLEVSELSDDLLKIVERVIQVNAAIGARDQESLTDLMSDHVSSTTMSARLENLPEIVRTMLRHPDLFALQTELGIQLLRQGSLAGRDRELAILRIGWISQAPYEWGEHVIIAKSLGITSDEIQRITEGSGADGWNEHERSILRAAEELHQHAMISDATWASLAKFLDDKQLIELPIVIGQYQTVAYYQNSLRMRLHSGNAGLSAR